MSSAAASDSVARRILDSLDADEVAALNAAGVVLVGSGPVAAETATVLAELGLRELTRIESAEFAGGHALDLVLDAELLIDADGTEATRFHANDIATVRGIPLVWAATSGRWGRVGIAWDDEGVDYRDLVPKGAEESAETGTAPVSALGPEVARAVVGHAVALLTGRGEDRLGRVDVIDGTTGAIRELAYRRAGGIRPGSIEERTQELEHSESLSMDALELAAELDGPTPPLLIDVREAHEHSFVSIPGSEHVPLRALILGIENLDHDANVVLYCHHGARSGQALATMRNLGFTNVRHLAGGIDAYSRIADPGLPRY